MLIYVGSSAPDGRISVFDADDDGTLRPAGSPVPAPAPSFLVAHPWLPVLYAANELAEGTITAYVVDGGGDLTPVVRQPSGGAEPCHLALTVDGRHLLVANFGSGSVAVLPLDGDGRPGPPSEVAKHTGVRFDPYPQEGPHAHHVSVLDGEVTVVDLGTDTLHGYALGPAGTMRPTWTAGAVPGTGPRNLVVHPSGRRYVADELSSTVSTYDPDPSTGGLRRIASVAATATGSGERNYPAEIAVDGDLLYLANRGRDTIAVFAIEGDALRPVDEVPSAGAWPRHFVLAGPWLYVANQRSHTVTMLRRDPSGGAALRPTGVRVTVPSPTCVLARER